MDSLDIVIKDYLETPDTDYAIMINGEWGCGKSYYLHHDFLNLVKGIVVPKDELPKGVEKGGGKTFSKRKRSKKDEFYSPAFISLYGVSSVDDFVYEVFCGINEWADGKLFRIASLLGRKIAGTKGIDTGKGDVGAITFLNKNKVLVFDDLERISEDHISVKEILGLINSYAELSHYKVVIVCNEKEFISVDEEDELSQGDTVKNREDTKREEYTKYKEKSVRFTYEFIPDIGAVYSRMVEALADAHYKLYLSNNRNSILSIFRLGGKKNLRTLKFFLDTFEKIYNATEESKHRDNVVYSFMVTFMIYVCENKRGIFEDDLKSLDMNKYKIDTSSFFGFLQDDQQGVSKDYSTVFRERYSDVLSEFKPDDLLIQYVVTGYLDTEDLKKSIQSIDADIDRMTIKVEGRVYQKLARMAELEDAEVEQSIEEILQYVGEDRYTLYDILNVYALLLKYDYWRIGGFELTDDIDKVFVTAIQRQKVNHKYDSMFDVRTPIWDCSGSNKRQYEKYSKMKEAAMEINWQAKKVEDQSEGELFLSIAEGGNVAKMRDYRNAEDNRISIDGFDWERVMNLIEKGSNPVACELCNCLMYFIPDAGFLKPEERDRIKKELLPALSDYLDKNNNRIRDMYVSKLRTHLAKEVC